MHSKTLFLAAAAFGAVNASPVFKRQASAVSSAVSGAVTSATGAAGGVGSSATSAVESATSAASTAVDSATSAASTAVDSVTATETAAETAAETATATETATAATPSSTDAASEEDDGMGGSELYPCPIGYLLTYSEVNQTLPIPVTEAVAAAGEWADSPLFPEVSEAMGGTEPGATHTINVLGVSIPEVLVNATANETSGFAQWVWNNTAPVSVPAQGIEISNYSTVFKAYDPDFTTTGEIGNTTLVQIFTNACANDQNATVTLLETLANFELSQLAAALGNETTPAAGGDVPATTTAATAEVTATETAEETAVQTSSAVETVSETVPAETATATETAATETVQSTAATSTAVTTAETVSATTTA